MLDLVGHRFGRLLVIERVPGGAWICDCDCGRKAIVTTSNLRGGNSTSCGCKKDEACTTHGMSRTKEYVTWKTMHHRCRSTNPAQRPHYLDRGIVVCAEWKDFTVFLRDMGKHPGKGYDLDRINNDLGYSKENCRYVSRSVNLNNRRCNRRITFNGKTQTIADWALETGINYRTLNNRINRGWAVEDAMIAPANTKGLN